MKVVEKQRGIARMHSNESFAIREREQPLQGDRVIPAKGHEVGATECQSK